MHEDLIIQKHRCANHNSYIKSAVSQVLHRGAMMSIMLQQCYNKVQWNKLFDKCTMWNCLSTILYWISHTITLVLLTNYLDLISAGVSHNCGYRMSSGIVNVGVNIRVTKLSYNTHHTQYWLTENQFHQHFCTFRFCDKNWGISVTVGTARTREHHTGVSHCEMSCKTNMDGDGKL